MANNWRMRIKSHLLVRLFMSWEILTREGVNVEDGDVAAKHRNVGDAATNEVAADAADAAHRNVEDAANATITTAANAVALDAAAK